MLLDEFRERMKAVSEFYRTFVGPMPYRERVIEPQCDADLSVSEELTESEWKLL